MSFPVVFFSIGQGRLFPEKKTLQQSDFLHSVSLPASRFCPQRRQIFGSFQFGCDIK
jgi:hypothetical protein